MSPTLDLRRYGRGILVFLGLVAPVTWCVVILLVIPLELLLFPYRLTGRSPGQILGLMLAAAAVPGLPLSVLHTYMVGKFGPWVGRRVALFSTALAGVLALIPAVLSYSFLLVRPFWESLNLVPCALAYGWIAGRMEMTGRGFQGTIAVLSPYGRKVAVFLGVSAPITAMVDAGFLAWSAWEGVIIFGGILRDFAITFLLHYVFLIPHGALVVALHMGLQSRWAPPARRGDLRPSVLWAGAIGLLDAAYAMIGLVAVIGLSGVTMVPSALVYGWLTAKRSQAPETD